MLGRAHLVEGLVGNLRSVSVAPVTFLCSPNDRDVIVECNRSGEDVIVVDWQPGRADYAKKINLGFRRSREPWVFTGASDLVFHSDWESHAMLVARKTGAGVVGTQDTKNPSVRRGIQSTHSLVSREYVEEFGSATYDESGVVYSEAYDHQFCNPAEAPIWMADMSFRPLGEIEAGDWVIGWHWPESTATYKMRRLTRSQVVAITERRSPLVRVVMESGREFRCTPDHFWLNGYWSPSTPYAQEWIRPRIGSSLLHVMDEPEPVPIELLRLAGWLGGIFDGEGNMSSSNPQIGQSRSANPEVYARIRTALDAFGIDYKATDDRVWLRGGRREMLRFFHITQPFKATRFSEFVLDQARFGLRDKMIHVEPAGEGWVYSMQTTTGNYIAWGYASRNCDVELVETAKLRSRWAFAKRSVVEHKHPHWGSAPSDETYVKAMRQTTQDRRLYVQRMKRCERALARNVRRAAL
jgi:hypothetical protein